MLINWKKLHLLNKPLTCDIHDNPMRRFFCKLHHYFIPHPHNNHYPQSIRPKALLTYTATLIGLKLLVTGILFVTVPNQAFLSQEIINKVHALTNESRLANGASVLALNSNLMEAAQAKANDMVAKGYFSHYTPEGNPPWFFIDKNIYPYEVAGENLAMNFTTAVTVHNAFLSSPSHKKNILDNRFNEVGFAVAHGEINGVQTQVLVEFFGKRNIPSTLPQPLPTSISEEVAPIQTPPIAVFTETVSSPPPAPSAAVAGITQEADTFSYSNELLIFANEKTQESIGIQIYRWSNYLFMFFIAFLAVSLAINIITRIRFQHGHLIVQTLLVIVLVTGLLYIRVHFLEGIPLELNIN
jgi:uncharacterized protein YkwD